jgi:glucosamine--fructose-6-phosphate aminotransferase (isomerizing)
MCGIFGYIGRRPALPVVLDGLQRLEYRGYDSAGVVLLEKAGLFMDKAAGKIASLRGRLNGRSSTASIGIGHTRWATHGPPTAENAHPHLSCDRKVAIVHNGIIENYAEIRRGLEAKGHAFSSQTDTEVLAHLIEDEPGPDPLRRLGAAVRKVHGSFAVVAMFADHPDRLLCARRQSPLIVGLNGGEHFIASDVPAILPHTGRFLPVEDGQIVDVRARGVKVFDFDLSPKRRRTTRVELQSVDAAQKHGFPHFMLKEIHEQPDAVARELLGRAGGFDEMRLKASRLKGVRRILLSACGTAWHASLYAKYVLEETAKVPADVWVSSELRYSPPPMDRSTLLIAVSQSGETADTLQAVRLARERGALTVGVTNSPASTLAREAGAAIYNRAGIEVGVAATKTYVAQLTALHLFALHLARARGALASAAAADRFQELLDLPDQLKRALEIDVLPTARRLKTGFDLMYIGRRHNVPTALEGALKMKEISYLHAEGYAAGEMKHGPLALVDERMAVVAIAPRGAAFDKIASNVEEIRARNGRVLCVVTKGESQMSRISDAAFEIPAVPEAVSPILAVVPLQLLAYHIAAELGRDVDQPRNLAKSVTVE